MTEAKRYGPTCDCMSEMAWGDYVRFSDYAALLAENARLLSAGQALEADFSSYRREVEHKHDALQSRLDAAESRYDEMCIKSAHYAEREEKANQQLAERDAVLRECRPAVQYESHRGDKQGEAYRATLAKIDALLSSAEPVKCGDGE